MRKKLSKTEFQSYYPASVFIFKGYFIKVNWTSHLTWIILICLIQSYSISSYT